MDIIKIERPMRNVLLTKGASTTTESIQFDGRAISLGTGTLHVPSSPSTSPDQVAASTDINLNDLRSTSPDLLRALPQASLENPDVATISSPTLSADKQSNDGQEINNLTHLLQQSAQQLLKTQSDMPPPSPTSAPSPRKRRRKRDDPQSCLTNSEEYDSDEASPNYAEVERFQGKVVYNHDGKAYIIDAESDLSLQLSDSSIKDVSQSNSPKIHSFRVISSRDATMNTSSSTQSSIGGATAQSTETSPCATPSLESQQQMNEKSPLSEKRENNQLQRQQKPILMCFICKLSFGNSKLFSSHANLEHKLNLDESEKMLLCREYSSAIIQKNSDEISQISFLEPLDAASAKSVAIPSPLDNININKNNLIDSVNDNNDNNNNSSNHDDGTENDDGMEQSLSEKNDKDDEPQPRLTPKSLSSLTGRSSPVPPPALNVLQRLTGGDLNKFLNVSADLSQLTTLLEQHKTLNEFLAQQQQQQQRLACPEHIDTPNLNEIDCKNCEFLNINNQLNSPLTLKSPIKGSFGGQQHQTESNASSTSSKTSSPITSSVTPNSALHQNLQQQSNLQTSPSFTIGACPDHINGRPIGVDCARCELLLNSARLNSGAQISTRNSCKTLKCPQCNWHYKYQETLEIHMREKHPDGESACGYCLAGAAHPRLARGESYTCGYKPYRCEICNYSTTTKGNLSIHMQSDKHLNNVQELNNSQTMNVTSAPTELRATQQPSQPNPVSAPTTPLPTQCKPKPKPSFRCEPCSYETPNARNYRIHETSEKHTHNLAVVQCNIKRLQDTFLTAHPGLKGLGNMPTVPSQLDQSQANSGHLPGAALADLAYNQALLIQLLHQNSVGLNNVNGPAFMSLLQQQQTQQQQQQQLQSAQQNSLHYQQMNGTNNQDIDQGLNPETLEPPFEQDFNPIYHYSCLICSNFNTNDLEELNNHINEDRSRLSFPQEFIVVVNNNNYTCRLCCYKTHLKANCQLHCKTDKHLQRVNFANHIKQGGPRNDYKFEYVINSTTSNNNYNITQLKCNCCDYYTNSIQKLNCHTQNIRHESMKIKFNHTLQLFKDIKLDFIDGQDNGNKAVQCQLCNYKSTSILDMMKHNKSLKHIQFEQIFCLQRRCESIESMDLNDVYQIVDDLDSSSEMPKEEERSNQLSPRGTPVSKSSKISENDYSSMRSSTPLNLLKMIPFEQLQLMAQHLPASQTIFKCNHCDHLSENKNELEQHFESNHPNNNDYNPIVLPSMSALMAAAQMNFEPKTEHNKHEDKCDDLMDKMLDDGEKNKQNCGDADVMTIEPDIDGVMINNSSRSSSAVSMLEGEDKISTGAMRTTPQNQQMPKSSPFSSSSTAAIDDFSTMCPLCQETFTERKTLEQHVMTIHSVNADGLNRLLQLVDNSHWLNQASKKSPERSTSTGGSSTSNNETECLVCSDTFKNMNDLLMHAIDHQHFTITGLNQFGCLLKTCHQRFPNEQQVQQHFRSAHLNVVISERHVYKYRCQMCPLAFKTEEKLNNHFMYHSMRDATKCSICNRNFRSTTSLQRHIEQVHGSSNQEHNKSSELTDDEQMQTTHDDAMSNDDDQDEFDSQNSDHVSEENSAKRFKAMKRNEKVTNYSLEKYNDPNRPYKCEDCLESFTQPNILTVHKNSVSHLHRVKQKQKESHSGSSTPALGTSPNQMSDFDRRSVDFDRKSVDYEMEISANATGDSNKRKLSSDNDYDSPKKRFKCDICKVAYAQGSTLDIHMRSVGHQAKANRIMQQQQQLQNTSSSTPSSETMIPSSNGNVSPKLVNNPMYKTLLENFGFDIVKQFNDVNKFNPAELMNLQAAAAAATKSQMSTPKKNGNADESKSRESSSTQITCRLCKQSFNNIFILKAHYEEIHGEKVSLEMLEKEQNNDVLDFSAQQPKLNAEIDNAAMLMNDPMKLFNPEMLQQKLSEQKFDPTMVAQRLMEQQFLAQFPQISQSLQNLSAGNMPMNTMEMLNLMQFHHLMSLNFMNLAPPLIFGGGQQGTNLLSPGSGVNPMLAAAAAASKASSDSTSAPNPSIAMLQQQQAAAAAAAASNQIQQVNKLKRDDKWNMDANADVSLFQACQSQKRARTRITDDQLKILRSHFDINNSPSEESIQDMSKKANLPQKVVKHWFRNTLFKERQRNKDSPYNFANPPSTTLNLEEYERTGQTKVHQISNDGNSQSSTSNHSNNTSQQQQQLKMDQQKLEQQKQQMFQQHSQAFNLSQQSQSGFPDMRPISQPSSTTSNERDDSFIKSEPMDEMNEMDGKNEAMDFDIERYRQQQAQNYFMNNFETKSESGSSDILSRPQSPSSLYSNLNDVINQQIDSIPINNIPGAPNMSQMGPPKKFQLNKIFDKSYESNSGGSNSSSSSGKRANRTRFTDYQIKVLQEFFENNSYPKDSDLEYLSKLLLLSPRVIVVWFQNARQKQRKIYENQPNTAGSPFENDDKKGTAINYTCKKCNLIFQRYYELIRHQKNHCFKEENNKKSAKAQIAAAQIAQSLSSEDSNSSLEINHASNLLGNNLLHPVTSTTKSQQNLALSFDAVAATNNRKTPPLTATKMNLNHPVNLITTTSASHPNIMQPLDFHQSSANNLPCHNQQLEAVDQHQQELLQNFKSSQLQSQQQQQQQNQQHQEEIQENSLFEPNIVLETPPQKSTLIPGQFNQPIANSYTTEQMQEFLMRKFSSQDFDLLTKNYDFFLQYYRSNCMNEQQVDENHLTMDFLTQFYHLNEFKKKLNGESEDNVSGDENDDIIALDDKDESDSCANQQGLSSDPSKKAGISSFNNNKRLRTTILPEQLNYLYECYQKESNPSRKQLEEIAKKVNLKKRVVQVWYQNSRARERKGQFRQNMQIINKKCPFCSAIFKVKSALESHLQTKHPDKQMVNIDSIPEIGLLPNETNFGMQISAMADFASAQQQQQQHADFWKQKAMLQAHATQQLFGGQKRLNDFSGSDISFTDSNNDEICEDDYDLDNFNDDSNQDEFRNSMSTGGDGKSKRHRTHVNRVQKSILRKIFDDVKSPSMIDCENIGREIGLFKRVVQVWFQNARANYKKFHKITTTELKHLPDRNPSECQFCPEYRPIDKTFQTHALSQDHIHNVHNYVLKNESHADDDDDDEECQDVEFKGSNNGEEKRIESFENSMTSDNRIDNFQAAYTMNNFPQKSLLVGDMNWVQ